MDIHINKKQVKVYKDNKLIKTKDISIDEYKSLMVELSGDRIGMIRTANKLFKPRAYRFKGVKL